MSKKRTKRQKAIIKRRIFLTCSAAVLVAVIALIAFSVNALLKGSNKDTDKPSDNKDSSSAVSTVRSVRDRFIIVADAPF